MIKQVTQPNSIDDLIQFDYFIYQIKQSHISFNDIYPNRRRMIWHILINLKYLKEEEEQNEWNKELNDDW
jgi:hypothetical protein